MKPPLVSILTPVHNCKDFIGPCIESSLAQTFEDFELVIVDNASTDGTWEICRQFAEKDSRVRLFRNAFNVGAIPNWIRSFQEARGVFGKIVFSDDIIHPRYLELTVPFMAEDVAFVVTPAEIGHRPGEGSLHYRWKSQSGVFPVEDYFIATLRRGWLPYSPVSTLYRLKDLRKNLRTDIASPTISDFAAHAAGPDLLLSLLTANSYAKVGFVAEPLAFFRDHPASLTNAIQDRLSDCYGQVRIWFGLQRCDRHYTAAALAATWMRHIRQRQRWIPPGEIKGRFLCDPSAVTTGELLAGAAHVLRMRMEEQLASALQRRTSGSTGRHS